MAWYNALRPQDVDLDYPITADERTGFWMSWTRLAIVWGFVLASALILRAGHLGVPLHILVDCVAISAAGCVAKLGWDAVAFAVECRRGGRVPPTR